MLLYGVPVGLGDERGVDSFTGAITDEKNAALAALFIARIASVGDVTLDVDGVREGSNSEVLL